MVVPIYQMSNIILFLHPTILFSFLQFFFFALNIDYLYYIHSGLYYDILSLVYFRK